MRLDLVAAILLNSALYLTGCFVAGLVTHNDWAWRTALASAGVTYLCYLAQLGQVVRPAPSDIHVKVFLVVSILLGLCAGLLLL